MMLKALPEHVLTVDAGISDDLKQLLHCHQAPGQRRGDGDRVPGVARPAHNDDIIIIIIIITVT